MLSYDLSDHELLKREVKRLPLQAQVLFPIEAPFLQSHAVSDSCSLLDIGCGDGSWLHLFRSAFPNSKAIGWDTLWSVIGPIILSGADSAECGLVDKATTWFNQNRENGRAVMACSLFMVSASNMVEDGL
jgi:hypothetical protein